MANFVLVKVHPKIEYEKVDKKEYQKKEEPGMNYFPVNNFFL